jgi:glutathione synthase/RimK-type ligase-like ATP-grasp enzyme
MTKKDAYIWYSGATDVTGKKLAEELGIDGGRDKPKDKKIVIGWGTKTKKDVELPAGSSVLNHPNNIRRNRNKLTTLEVLKGADVAVADFVPAENVMAELGKKVSLPVVGRTKYHQGGKGFWLCLTKTHVTNAINEGAQYFQNYIDIVDEYRLHIFKGELLRAQKKVKRDNMEEAYVEQHAAKIKDYATKGDVQIDENTLKYALGRVAKEHKQADMIVRSNRRGWKFANVKNPKKALVDVSVAALNAIGLEFGAVDCCLDGDGNAWIIEINSGPGLEGNTFKAYTEAFEDALSSIMKPAKKVVAKTAKAADAVAKKDPKKEAKSKLGGASAKERLSGLRELLDLVGDADEAEAAAVEGLLKKRLGE